MRPPTAAPRRRAPRTARVEAAPSLELDSGDPAASPAAPTSGSSTPSARLSLGAEADEVQDVANGVVEVTDRYDGVVVDSQVTSDQAGARASFELEIPYSRPRRGARATCPSSAT